MRSPSLQGQSDVSGSRMLAPCFGNAMSLACAPIHSLRRTFFAVACTFVGSLASLNSFAWDLTILHVNDVHSAAAGVNDRGPVYDDTNAVGGLARVTAFVADEKAKAKVQGKAVLALDTGDFWQGTHFFRTGGMPWAQEAMRRMPWDAVTLGNHEFDLGCETLARYVKALPFPVLASNLEKNPACPLSTAPLPATVVKDFNGVKVGIIGLANDEGKDISEACPETNFADRATALRRAVAELEKAGVTHIIAVTHVGYEADQALARAVPAIDVIVGGHTHSVLGNHPHSEGPYPTVIPHGNGSQTLVVQAGRSTRYLGRLSVSFDDAGRIVQFKGDLEELVPSLRCDEPMHEFVVQSIEAIRADQERFVGVNTSMLPDGLDACREGDCLSGMATADAFLAWGQSRGAVAAILNGGAIRAAMPIGPVTYADLLDIHPFGNHIQLADVSGAVLREALEHGLSEPDVIGPKLLQTAGLRYRLNPAAPMGQRIVSAEIRAKEGTWEPIQPKNVYRIVTISYLLRGGDHFSMLGQHAKILETGPLEVEILETYLHEKQDLDNHLPTPVPGRIAGMPAR